MNWHSNMELKKSIEIHQYYLELESIPILSEFLLGTGKTPILLILSTVLVEKYEIAKMM